MPAALCSSPVDIDNGMVTFTGNSIGDTATYSCNSGYELEGATTTTCLEVDPDSAQFSPEPPVCMRESCMNVIEVAINLICVNHTGMRALRRSTCIYEKLTEVYCKAIPH